MTVPAAAAGTGKLVPAAVLSTTVVRFALTGLYEVTAVGFWGDAAGIVGLFCARWPCTRHQRSRSRM
jgi:uncharacterized protein